MKLGLSPRVIRGTLTALLMAMGMLPATRTDAAVPATMSYQGSLKDPAGQPAPDGNHSFVFRLFNVETGGSSLWQETQTLPTGGGLFNALLGAVTPLNLPFDAQYWLESTVDGSLLAPRVKLASAPYAQRALVADSVVGGGGGGIGGSGTPGMVPRFADATTLTNSLIFDTGQIITIGQGYVLAPAGLCVNPTPGSEARIAVSGETSPELVLRHSAATGGGRLSFQGNGTNEWSVYRDASTGALRFNAGNSLDVLSLGADQAVVQTSSYGSEVAAFCSRYAGSVNDVAAVKGVSKPADYWGIGGSFEGGYIGVSGSVNPTGGGSYLGVSGTVQGPNGSGMKVGVYGKSTGTGSNYGVYAEASGGSADYAGWFTGNVLVSGNLSVSGTKSFRIDHPTDPANKYLNHFCTESSEVLNTYSGNVVLGGGGEAWVQLADWFESINRDPRYQLTCIGGSAPVYVAEEISGNRFKIAGGQSGLKVSWQVIAVRDDAATRRYQTPVEQEKPGPERGKYLEPSLYGQPEAMRIGYFESKRTAK